MQGIPLQKIQNHTAMQPLWPNSTDQLQQKTQQRLIPINLMENKQQGICRCPQIPFFQIHHQLSILFQRRIHAIAERLQVQTFTQRLLHTPIRWFIVWQSSRRRSIIFGDEFSYVLVLSGNFNNILQDFCLSRMNKITGELRNLRKSIRLHEKLNQMIIWCQLKRKI